VLVGDGRRAGRAYSACGGRSLRTGHRVAWPASGGAADASSVAVSDLEGDGEPEGDLGSDGRLELVTGDDRFSYAFGCYACSAVPVLVQRYEQGRLVNVTRSFPRAIRADATRIWSGYRRAVRKKGGYSIQSCTAFLCICFDIPFKVCDHDTEFPGFF
jgi:hypothetical protein